jgi:hypothetical protein
MKEGINKRWLVVGVIWITAFLVNYWNIGEMYRIREAREQKVFLTMDEQFLRAHAEEISDSLKKREAFFHSPEALNLGLLTVENELGALAARHELTKVEVMSEVNKAEGGTIPMVFSCEGSLKKMVECLETLRRDYAYAPITKVRVAIERRGAPARCEVWLKYRYRIVEPETRA